MSITLAAAVAAPATESGGWAHLIGLLSAAAIFYLFAKAHTRWLSTRPNPSPTDGQKALGTLKPQVKGESGSDGSTRGVVVRKTNRAEVYLRQNAAGGNATKAVEDAAKALNVSKQTAWRAWSRLRKGGAS